MFRTAAVVLALVVLAACGGAGTPNRPPAATPSRPPSGGPGVYELEYKGAIATVSVPAGPKQPALAEIEEIEEYRELARAPEVTYITVEADNTAGSENINFYKLVIVTDDGQQIEAEGVEFAIGKWQEAFSDEKPTSEDQLFSENYELGTTLHNKHQVLLRPGAKGTVILYTAEPIPSIARVYAYPIGFDQVEATKKPT